MATTVEFTTREVTAVFEDGLQVQAVFGSALSVDVTFGGVGPAGPGVAPGGTEGMLVEKASATDYDTRWTDTLENSNLTIDGGLL